MTICGVGRDYFLELAYPRLYKSFCEHLSTWAPLMLQHLVDCCTTFLLFMVFMPLSTVISYFIN